MHLDGYVALAGVIVGFTVGLTGMGGGALMTPLLVLLFKVQPLAAVSSDLVAAMVMKPVGGTPRENPFRLKRSATLTIGALGGLIVGMTSVGSGSLIIVALLLLYPMLRSRELVGTDLVQAVPLVASAALAHILFGDFQLS